MKILLTAPSNDAADLLVERLSTFFPPNELRRVIAYSRTIDSVPSAIRQYVPKEGCDNDALLKDIMSASIVVSTLNLASKFSFWGIPNGHFDVMVVDEAGQAMEPEIISVASSLINFSTNDILTRKSVGQLILAGDPKQLGPIVSSSLCQKFNLDLSYLERLMKRNIYSRQANGQYMDKLLVKLVRNYRSHEKIVKLANEMFYDNELICSADHMTSHSLFKWEHLPVKGFPIIFHNVEGENLRECNSPSWFNPQEAELVVEYVQQLMHNTRPPLKSDEIGIVTPYAQQAQKIRKALDMLKIKNIKVGSVESFQGQERRCIIVSTVRSDNDLIATDMKFNLGFITNEKRFNVIMTRAKALFIVIGCARVLANDTDHWLKFLHYCYENKSWCGEEWDLSSSTAHVLTSDEYIDEDDEWDMVDNGNGRGELPIMAPQE